MRTKTGSDGGTCLWIARGRDSGASASLPIVGCSALLWEGLPCVSRILHAYYLLVSAKSALEGKHEFLVYTCGGSQNQPDCAFDLGTLPRRELKDGKYQP